MATNGYEDLSYIDNPGNAPITDDTEHSIDAEGINVTGVEYEGDPTVQTVVSEQLNGDIINVYLHPEINHTFAPIRGGTDTSRLEGMVDASGTYNDDVSTGDEYTSCAPTLRCPGIPELHEWVCSDGNREWDPHGICCIYRR